jgi:hypothetical protein
MLKQCIANLKKRLHYSLNFLLIIAWNEGKGYAPSRLSALEPSAFSITNVGVP